MKYRVTPIFGRQIKFNVLPMVGDVDDAVRALKLVFELVSAGLVLAAPIS